MKIDGKKIAESILGDLRDRVGKLKKKNITPCLAIILISNDPASFAYVRQKELKAQGIGVKTLIKHLPIKASESHLIETIKQFNDDNNIHGVIVQRPLPKEINEDEIAKAIDPKKDVDGFNPQSKFETPIALAVLKILAALTRSILVVKNSLGNFRQGVSLSNWLKSKKIIVIGKGETGGKPIIEMFEKMNIELTIIDSKTINYELLTRHADIIISAVGKPRIITANQIKKGVILISVGLFRGKDGKLHGDYEEDEIKNLASFYTPTPGGVGPVNVAMLLKNLVTAAEKKH